MVHIGCGADVIRQRRRADARRKEQIEQGLVVKDWKPARNKKYPHYTPARNRDVFNNQRCSYHRLLAVQEEENRKKLELARRQRQLQRLKKQNSEPANVMMTKVRKSSPVLERSVSDQTPFQRWISRPLSSLSSSLDSSRSSSVNLPRTTSLKQWIMNAFRRPNLASTQASTQQSSIEVNTSKDVLNILDNDRSLYCDDQASLATMPEMEEIQ